MTGGPVPLWTGTEADRAQCAARLHALQAAVAACEAAEAATYAAAQKAVVARNVGRKYRSVAIAADPDYAAAKAAADAARAALAADPEMVRHAAEKARRAADYRDRLAAEQAAGLTPFAGESRWFED